MEILTFFKETEFGHVLMTFFASMLPVLELRGGIPLGVSLGLSHWAAMGISVLGNMVPVPFIIIFIRRIFAWMRKHFPKLENIVIRLENKAYSKKEFMNKWKVIGLLTLVAIPLPGTGAWTGALVAALLDIRMRSALPVIFAGVIIAGFLVTGITFGFTELFV